MKEETKQYFKIAGSLIVLFVAIQAVVRVSVALSHFLTDRYSPQTVWLLIGTFFLLIVAEMVRGIMED